MSAGEIPIITRPDLDEAILDKANLDSNSKVVDTEIPDKFDDVVNYDGSVSGEQEKLYVDTVNNRLYRWNGTAYVLVASGNVESPIAPSTEYTAAGKPADAKATGEQLAGKASTEYATLVDGFCDWVVSPASFNGESISIVETPNSTEGMSNFVPKAGEAEIGDTIVASSTSTSLSWTARESAIIDISATRRSCLILGNQTGKKIQPSGDFALKSEFGTAASKDVPESGDAASDEVVLGNDSRLSDERPPAEHASTHATGGDDALSPGNIGAVEQIDGEAEGLLLTGPGNREGHLVISNNGSGIAFQEDGVYSLDVSGSRITFDFVSGTDTDTSFVVRHDIAPEYDDEESHSYEVGQLVLHSDSGYKRIYRCTTAHTATSWASANWTAANVEDVLAAIRSTKADKTGVTAPVIETTWSNLKSIRDAGTLVPGQQYRITDYVATTSQQYTRSAGHQFDLIVTADSTNTLNEKARAVQHAGDHYFDGVDMNAWEVWYCLDNDYERFSWAMHSLIEVQWTSSTGKYVRDTSGDNTGQGDFQYCWTSGRYHVYTVSGTPGVNDTVKEFDGSSVSTGTIAYVVNDVDNAGRGVIYRLIDDHENDVCYDFKGIQFMRWEVTDVTSDVLSSDQTDYVFNFIVGYLFACEPRDFSIGYGNKTILNCTVAPSSGQWVYTFHDIYGASDYSFRGNMCVNNVVQKTTVNALPDNVFYDGADSNNVLGEHNTLLGTWLVELSGSLNVLTSSCGFIRMVESSKNMFISNCENIHVGAMCRGNLFIESCTCNTLGSRCFNNVFGEYCENNVLGDGCESIVLGNNCKNSVFGGGCNNVVFGSSPSSPKSFYENIVVEPGVHDVYLNCTAADLSEAEPYRNVTIASGVKNATITDSNKAQAYKTTYQPSNSRAVSV